jgi:hypothetical protein
LREIRESVAEVVDGYRERLESLNDEMRAELDPFRARLEALRRAVQIELAIFDPDLPPMPEPETPPESDGWLFDASRDYLDQIRSYKDHQSGGG